ncbi:MAG TPA: glycoside hydrolase family 2 TIM barrel-domain containing protein [Pyrinomonadaceae bacterium]|nr:glycoside hydrolase family 2 TIM barrel-domain containing protein [Pyrinomonadaceae bacterium]
MSRTRIILDGLWDFYIDPRQHLTPQTLEGEGGAPRRIQVPGPWQAQFEDLRNYSGVAWYRHTFEFPKGFFEQAVLEPTYVLHFGAVDYYTTVWLNGQKVGEHEGGYLPFDLKLDEALRPDGPNELIVRVIDPGDDEHIGEKFNFAFTEIPHGKQSWYGPIGGIWQSVYMEARHATHITGLHITPDIVGQLAQVNIRLNRPAIRAMGVMLTLTDPQEQLSLHRFTLREGEQEFQTSLSIPDPLLWDTVHPNLYYLEAALVGEEDLRLDSVSSNFGMRSISASAEGHLMLNGRILYLRGALDQDYYPASIYTPFSDLELEDQFAKAKHMGLNCLRTHIKITDPRYYDAADRAGLLIWTELPNWENLTPAVKERARETLDGMIERDWNHPSIVIWTIVNEGWGVDLAANPEHRAWLAETYDYLKKLDPHRLVVGNSACFTNFHVVTDIEDFHNYYSIPDHYRQWRSWVETFAGRAPWSFAHAYENIDEWREFLRDPWNKQARSLAPEVRRRGNEPMVVSEFGNWGLPDVSKLRLCYGGHDPWWFETGIEWGEGAVYPHGVEDRYKTWHLDKIFPTFSDLAAGSQRMQFCALKYQIEQMRRHPSIVGYIITEFTDVHWECNGLLDMCRNPKTFYEALANVNSADAIVPDWERVSFWEGERCQVRLALSHFSSTDLGGCKLEWSLDQWPEVSGVFEGLMPRSAQIIEIGTVDFEVPAPERGQRVRLEMRLINAAGELVTSNHQEMYFFPRAVGQATDVTLCAPPELAETLRALGYKLTDNLADADLAVVEKMTDDLRRYVQSGGRVLWMAQTAESQQTYLGNLTISERQGRRWQGDWANNMNWIRQDQLFGQIPTGGLVDFAFADLTPDHVIVGLNPREFASDVHAGLFVGWIHHTVALIAERRFGNGRLMVSTFQLRQHLLTQPVAAIMLRDMVIHLARVDAEKQSEPDQEQDQKSPAVLQPMH